MIIDGMIHASTVERQREKGKAEMIVTISTFLAKFGQEDAIIALYEDWQRNLQPKAKGYLSGELLRNVNIPREFITMMHFDSWEAIQALTSDPEQNVWYGRLVSLVENVPVQAFYTIEWRGMDNV